MLNFIAPLFCLGCLVVTVKLWKALKSCQAQVGTIDVHLARISNEMNLVNQVTCGIGKHVREIEGKVVNIDDKQIQLDDKSASDASYLQAAKLVKMGATIKDIMESCQLTRAEAELVDTLERAKIAS